MTAYKLLDYYSEPQIDAERYATLAGYDFMTGLYEPYDTLIPDPDDQRFLMSTGPFDLAPDSTATLVFAVMITAWNNNYETPDTALALIDRCAQLLYDMYWFIYTGIEEDFEFRISKCGLTVAPNPVTHDGNVRFSLTQPGRITLKLYNTLGQLVKILFEGTEPAGNRQLRINTRNLSHGTYFLVLETREQSKSQSFVVVR
jgi:hypothetical protein